MTKELLELYAMLVQQRKELVKQLDQMEPNPIIGRQTEPEARLRREIKWREDQIIALLGGIVRYESY